MADPKVHILDSNNVVDIIWHDYIDQSHMITQPVVGVSGFIECSSTSFPGSKFTASTATVEASFEISQPISDSVDSLLLALETVGTSGFSIGDILTAFAVDTSTLPPLVGTIIAVLQIPNNNVLPKFQIDTSAGSKNGVWLVALNSATLEVCRSGRNCRVQSAKLTYRLRLP